MKSHENGVTVVSPLGALLWATGLRWLLVCFRKYPELQLAIELLNIIGNKVVLK